MTSRGKVYLEAHASLRLFAEDLDPSEVTRTLRLPPDQAHRKGDLRIRRTRKGKVQEGAPYSAGMWSMSTEGWVTSPRLHVHIQWLLDQLQPKLDALTLILAGGVSADVFCYSLGRSAKPPPVPRALLERLRELGLPLEIDHYQIEEDEGPEPEGADRMSPPSRAS